MLHSVALRGKSDLNLCGTMRGKPDGGGRRARGAFVAVNQRSAGASPRRTTQVVNDPAPKGNAVKHFFLAPMHPVYAFRPEGAFTCQPRAERSGAAASAALGNRSMNPTSPERASQSEEQARDAPSVGHEPDPSGLQHETCSRDMEWNLMIATCGID